MLSHEANEIVVKVFAIILVGNHDTILQTSSSHIAKPSYERKGTTLVVEGSNGNNPDEQFSPLRNKLYTVY
ncbi:MAG: hypothetical protein IJX23_02250 [Clostridia bacterium]|nr:hypothetical protein [Clostridia bacterium]